MDYSSSAAIGVCFKGIFPAEGTGRDRHFGDGLLLREPSKRARASHVVVVDLVPAAFRTF